MSCLPGRKPTLEGSVNVMVKQSVPSNRLESLDFQKRKRKKIQDLGKEPWRDGSDLKDFLGIAPGPISDNRDASVG